VKLLWTEPAKQDLRDIFSYIAEENPHAARRLLAKIRERALLLQDRPELGRPGRVDGTRELVISGTQYILPYRINAKQIQVLAVFHGARQWPEDFKN